MSFVMLLLSIGGSLALLFLGVMLYVLFRVQRLPACRPDTFVSFQDTLAPSTQVVVCAGDSLTHGSISHPWVERLASALGPEGYRFVNAGINSELAWNLLQRIDGIIACRPQQIILLIGTNDVLASAGEQNSKRYRLSNRLPQAPSLEWYQENLTTIVRTLKERTNARIAIMSLPLVTEDLLEPMHARLEQYVEVIRALARQEGLEYLPLFEQQVEVLRSSGHVPRRRFQQGIALPTQGVVRLFLRGHSLDDLAAENGYLLLTDGIHLGSRGGTQIEALVSAFVRQSSTSA